MENTFSADNTGALAGAMDNTGATDSTASSSATEANSASTKNTGGFDSKEVQKTFSERLNKEREKIKAELSEQYKHHNMMFDKVIASITPPKYVTDWSKYEYFKKEEFVCGCNKPNHKKYCNGYPVEVTAKLMDALMMIRTHFNKPVNITSGVRCIRFNASLKGSSPLSAHLKGGAADFYVSDTNIKDVLAYCAKLKLMGYIKYYYTNSTNMKGAVHINI